MKVEVTRELMDEIACCIVHNNLTDDEACEYAWQCLVETFESDCEDIYA